MWYDTLIIHLNHLYHTPESLFVNQSKISSMKATISLSWKSLIYNEWNLQQIYINYTQNICTAFAVQLCDLQTLSSDYITDEAQYFFFSFFCLKALLLL